MLNNINWADLDTDEGALEAASFDFGRVVRRRPCAIARPASPSEMAEIIHFANRQGIPLAIQGAAHSQSANSLTGNGILVDMTGLNRIGNIENEEISVQAGVRWRDLVHRTYPQGYLPLALTSHLSSTVGGTLSSGGFGSTGHLYGIQTDIVTELEAVSGDGRLLRCSPGSNADLFDCIRGGQGQFGVLTAARIKLRRVQPYTRTFKLVYDDIHPFMQDLELLVKEERFQYIETWCAPAAKDPWQIYLGQRFGRRLYTLDLTAEWDDLPPDRDELLRDLSYTRLLGSQDAETIEHVQGNDKTGAGIWFSDWGQSHPCMEGFIPWDTFPRFIAAALTELPGEVALNSEILLGPFRNDRVRSPLVMRPEGELFMGFGILIEVPTSQLEQALPILWEVNCCLTEMGGKRYLSGWVDYNLEQWQAHYGKQWAQLVQWKREFDPNRVLNPGAIPF